MRIAWNSTEELFFLILHQRDNDHGMLIQEISKLLALVSVQWHTYNVFIEGTPGSVDSYLWLVQTMNESLPSEYVIQGFPANFWSSAFTITNGSEAVSSSASIATATSTRGSNELSGLPRATFIPLSTPTTSASKSSSGGLSMGTTIGLAVGFTAGSIGILIYLLNFLYKRRKAKANPYTAKSAPEGGADEHLPEVHTYEPVPIEGDAKPVELEVKPAEMDGTSTCAELPAEKKLLRVEDLDELVVSPRK
jgi:hypothetical protein